MLLHYITQFFTDEYHHSVFMMLLFIFFDFPRRFPVSPLITYNFKFALREFTERAAFERRVPRDVRRFTAWFRASRFQASRRERRLSRLAVVSLVVY
jgi:hypothetical protein